MRQNLEYVVTPTTAWRSVSFFFYILRYLTYLATKMHARVIFKGIQIVRININHNLLYSSAFLMTCCFVGCHS